MELNSLNLSCIEFNNGNEYYYKNKNYNLGYNQNNFYGNNINNFKGQKNPNLKYNNKFAKNKEYINNNNYYSTIRSLLSITTAGVPGI